MKQVLFKTLVARYYEANTGFFLLLFLAMFGVLNGEATIELHHVIMLSVTSSSYWMGVAMLVWGAYNMKCILFIVKALQAPQNKFLYGLQATDNKRQLYALLQCHASLYLPVLLYAGFTVFVGFAEKQFIQPVLIILYQLLMCGAGVAVYFNIINTTWQASRISFRIPVLFTKKRFEFYLLHYSLYYKKATFIGIKVFSVLLLQAMALSNRNSLSKEAVCVLIMFLISAHTMLPVYYTNFLERDLTFLRNLPLPRMRVWFVFIVTYAIIFLPELAFLLVNEQHVMPISLILSLYALGICQMLFYTSLLYLNISTEKYTGAVFGIFFIGLLLLASFNLWFLAISELFVATVMFLLLYRRYEYKIAV
jgi:hypothetical protein